MTALNACQEGGAGKVVSEVWPEDLILSYYYFTLEMANIIANKRDLTISPTLEPFN